VTQRSVDTIIADFNRFQTAGGNLKKAKDYHNCVRAPITPNVPLDQVYTLTSSTKCNLQIIASIHRFAPQDYTSLWGYSTGCSP